MLPGFRFLFAAVVLSFSITVFGLGAAALLRAAHEQVASIPARPAPPEPVFAQRPETTEATLALFRVDAPGPANADHAQDTDADREPASTATDGNNNPSLRASSASVENPAAGPVNGAMAPQGDATSAQNDPASAQTDTPSPATDMKMASNEAALASNEVTATPPVSSTASPEAGKGETRTAALGDAPAAILPPTAAKATSKPDRSAAIRRRRAEHAAELRKRARRLRLARLAQQQQTPLATTPQLTTQTEGFMTQQQQQPQITATTPAARTRR